MAIPDLPVEILFHHILCRLPVKSVLCFRSVCKAWNRMLRHQQFVKLHLKYHQQQAACDHNKKLLFSSRIIKTQISSYYSITCDEPAPVDIDDSKITHYLLDYYNDMVRPCSDEEPVEVSELPHYILGTCNGLVAILYMHLDFKPRGLILRNPSTRESKYIIDDAFTFDGLYGFAYDSISRDYKIIHIKVLFFKEIHVQIYSVRNKSWKTVKVVPYSLFLAPADVRKLAGVELNGYIYWMVRSRSQDQQRFAFIIGFGLKDENLIFIELPWNLMTENCSEFCCDALRVGLKAMGRSCIAAFCFYKNDKFLVWTSKDPKKKEWEKLICMSLSFEELKFTCSMRPVWFTKDGKVLLIIGFNGFNKEVFNGFNKDPHQYIFGVYDPQKNSLGYVPIHGIKNTRRVCMEMEYIPSLVSPNMFDSGTTEIQQVMEPKKRKWGC